MNENERTRSRSLESCNGNNKKLGLKIAFIALVWVMVAAAVSTLRIMRRRPDRRPGPRGSGDDGGIDEVIGKASLLLDESVFDPIFQSEHRSNAELLERIVMAERGSLKVVDKLRRIKVAAFAGFAFFGLYACANFGTGRLLHSAACCAAAHDCFVVSYNAYHKKYLVAVANHLSGDLIAMGKTLLDLIAGKSSLDAMKEDVSMGLLVQNTIAKTLLHKFGKFLNK